MQRIGNVLPTVLNRRGLQKQARASLVTHQAQEWLNRTLPAFSGDIQATKYADATLTIGCRHSIASQEVQQLIPVLLEYLRTDCNHPEVEGVNVTRNS